MQQTEKMLFTVLFTVLFTEFLIYLVRAQAFHAAENVRKCEKRLTARGPWAMRWRTSCMPIQKVIPGYLM